MSRVKLSSFVFNQIEDSLTVAADLSKEQSFNEYTVYYQKLDSGEFTVYLNEGNESGVYAENVESRDEVKVVTEDYILTNIEDLDEYMVVYDSFGLFE